MVLVGRGEAHEEQEQAEEHRWVVRKHDHAVRKSNCTATMEAGNTWADADRRRDPSRRSSLLNSRVSTARVGGDGECRLPAKVAEHIGHVPAPGGGHHQHGWCGEGRQRAANRH